MADEADVLARFMSPVNNSDLSKPSGSPRHDPVAEIHPTLASTLDKLACAAGNCTDVERSVLAQNCVQDAVTRSSCSLNTTDDQLTSHVSRSVLDGIPTVKE